MRDRNVEFDVIEYLKEPPDKGQLITLLKLLPYEPKELLHPASFKKLGLDIKKYNTPKALVELLLEHPEIMNRPICIRGSRGIIARPASLIEDFLLDQ